MSPRFVLGRENMPCVAEVVNRSLKADCTDFTVLCSLSVYHVSLIGFHLGSFNFLVLNFISFQMLGIPELFWQRRHLHEYGVLEDG